MKALKGSPTPQAQYWAGLAVWELSFEEQAARGFDRYVHLLSGVLEKPRILNSGYI